MMEKPQLLLHVCCGPCATAVIERLLPEFDVTAFWYNPNIQPKSEHDLRLENVRTVVEHFGVELIVAPRDEGGWLEGVRGLEGEPEGGRRCDVCFEHRLRRAARQATECDVDYLATTLTVSPHKPAGHINAIGRNVVEGGDVRFLQRDFKKCAGFQRSVELSGELDLYRQTYCGCLFAKNDEPSRQNQ